MFSVADVGAAAAASAVRRQTWRFDSCLDGRVALNLAVRYWPWLGYQVVDAMVETIHLAPHPMKMLLKPPGRVFELLVETDVELLGILVDSLRRNLLARLAAMQPVYS
jgi:hypothetical protein